MGQAKASFFMPLSPARPVHRGRATQDGALDATPDQTQLLQRMQVERAFRSVFALAVSAWVERIRPRTVDLT